MKYMNKKKKKNTSLKQYNYNNWTNSQLCEVKVQYYLPTNLWNRGKMGNRRSIWRKLFGDRILRINTARNNLYYKLNSNFLLSEADVNVFDFIGRCSHVIAVHQRIIIAFYTTSI